MKHLCIVCILIVAATSFASDPQSTVADQSEYAKATPSVVTETAPQVMDRTPPGVLPPGDTAIDRSKSYGNLYGLNEPTMARTDAPDVDLSKDIVVHELDWYAVSSMGLTTCTGLDFGYASTGPVILCAHPDDDTLRLLDLETLALEDTWSLDPSNSNDFAVSVFSGVYTNDWFDSSYFYTSSPSGPWSSYTNPAGANGRGMDYDYWHTNLMWQAHSNLADGVYSLIAFTPGTTTGTWYDISSFVPGQLSGLAVFDLEGMTGIAVNCYLTQEVFFFAFDGAEIHFLGTRLLPWANVTNISLGLAYASENGLFYYSFSDINDNIFISKLQLDFRALFQDGFDRGHSADWSCDGNCCGGYTFDCNPNEPCLCYKTTEGDGFCGADIACDPALACGSSDDCLPGSRCVTCTCCGYDLCARQQCEFPDGSPPIALEGRETAAGR